MAKRTFFNTGPLVGTPDNFRAAFASLHNRADVAKALQVDLKDLHYWFYRHGANYRQFQVPKRSGGHRTISAPAGGPKLVQQRLAQVLGAVYRRKSNVHGFVEGYGIVSNAATHVRRRWVLNIDLEDFFGSVHYGRVRGLFVSMGVGLEAADLLARISCHEGKLPQGAPTSPVVTNLICRSFDRSLQEFARQHRCRVTRYADDITLSTLQPMLHDAVAKFDQGLGEPVVVVGDGLRSVVAQHGFSINPSKIRLRSQGRSQQVTGLVVNEKVNVPRAFVRSVRGMLHAAEKHGVTRAEQVYRQRYGRQRAPGTPPVAFLRALRGKLEFVRVKGDRNPTFTRLWNRACKLDPRLQPRVGSFADVDLALWVIESESDVNGHVEQHHGTAFHIREVGLVTAAHCIGARVRLYQKSRPNVVHKAVILRLCYERDLCVVEVPKNVQSASLELGDPFELRVGTTVCSAGFPDTPASISHQEGQLVRISPRFGHVNFFTNFVTRKGASGSPLLDSDLRVVGVVLHGPDRIPGAEEDGPASSAITVDELQHVVAFSGQNPELLS